MEGTVDLRSVAHAILTCVTAGPGLGFNRAVLFLEDDDHAQLLAAMAIGPASPEEAQATWARLAREQTSLDELLRRPPGEAGESGFSELVEGLAIPLEPSDPSAAQPNPLVEAYRTRRIVKVADAAALQAVPPRLQQLFGGTEMVCVPLVVKERSLGVIVADNAFSHAPIGTDQTQLLELLALLAGLAVDNARICKEAERQAKQLRDTLDQLNTTQDQLLHSERLATVGAVAARVSHEIRNPLTTIGSFARTLSAHPDDMERVGRNAQIIVEEVEKLEALLKEMLDFVSPRPPLLEPTDLNQVIHAFTNVHRGELSDRHVSLALDLASDLPAVAADRDQIRRVFLNLWQNALHAMEAVAEERTKTLTLRTWRNGVTVNVAFSDTGTGIPRDVRPQIFTPFVTTKQRGTGLGLAVIKKIVDDHRGHIDVETKRGRGTTFTIALPIGR